MSHRFRWVVLTGVVLWTGCDSPTAPTSLPPASPPPEPAPIVCPANINRQAPDGRPLSITYDPPTIMGQTIQKMTCSQASGSLFPAGAATRVDCEAPVSPELTASCSFTVTVTIPLTCPVDITRQSLDGRPVQITYSAPTVPGAPPPQVVCSPASGSLFRAGETTRVNCRVPEAPDLITACSFNVSIVIPPQLSVTRFMAFGDSITDGFLLCDPCPSAFLSQWSNPLDLINGRFASDIFIHPQPDKSYPSRLQTALAARYTVHPITVTNRGLGGERASQGRLRLPGELTTYRPEVLLVFEGVNDINLALVTAPGQRVSVSRIRDDLRAMVQTALASNVKVMLATLTPIASTGSKADPLAADAVIRLNQEIRSLAAAFNLGPVVDLHAALSADPTLIGTDGLHPTAAGYQRMADTFFPAIVSRYDVTPLPQPVPAPLTSTEDLPLER